MSSLSVWARGLIVAALTTTSAWAADPNSPHPHSGELAPYSAGAPSIDLTPDDLEKLSAGRPATRTAKDGSGGRGMAVQDVHASPDLVWKRILDYANYPNMVEQVKLCETYETAGDHIKTRFIIAAMGFKYEYFIDHIYKPDANTLTWTLDYSRESDLGDSVGYWYVIAHPDNPGWTRVFYSVDIQPRGWVPQFVIDLLTKRGLVEATGWVKAESEAAQRGERWQ